MALTQDAIDQWARRTLDGWELLAYQKLLSKSKLDDYDVDEMCVTFLKQHELAIPDALSAVTEVTASIAVSQPAVGYSAVVKITDIINVNALASDAYLTFQEKGLTVIYGLNGAGKSGFGRVFALACAARGLREVLPNISINSEVPLQQSATFSFSDGSTVEYDLSGACEALSHHYFFDSKSVVRHLDDKSAFVVIPKQLQLLRDLAKQTDLVRKRLDGLALPSNAEPALYTVLRAGGEVKAFIASLPVRGYVESIDTFLASHPHTDEHLTEKEHSLGMSSPEETQSRLKHLDHIIGAAANIQTQLNEVSKELFQEVPDQLAALFAEKANAEKDSASFAATYGATTEAEQAFLIAAAHIIEFHRAADPTYPSPGNKCPLCSQHLTPEVAERLVRIHDYIKLGITDKLQSINASIAGLKSRVTALSLAPLNKSDFYIAYLSDENHDLYRDLCDFLVLGRAFRDRLIATIDLSNIELLKSEKALSSPDLTESLMFLRETRRALSERDKDAGIAALRESVETAREVQLLLAKRHELEAFLQQREWSASVREPSRRKSTIQITLKQKELYEKHVSGAYLEIFRDLLSRLCPSLEVSTRTIAEKGQSYKRIVLTRAQANSKATPSVILSEGEQKALASSMGHRNSSLSIAAGV